MARTVKEWIGKNDDAAIPTSVKRRIVNRQDGCCALTGRPFGPGNKPEFDHKVALWLGGEHRESNLQAICKDEHKAKTKAEATVRAKVNSQHDKHIGLKNPKGSIPGRGFPKSGKSPRIDKSALPTLPRTRLMQAGTARNQP